MDVISSVVPFLSTPALCSMYLLGYIGSNLFIDTVIYVKCCISCVSTFFFLDEWYYYVATDGSGST